MNATSTAASPEALREAMVTNMKEAGCALSRAVEEAFRAVERHAFVPEAALADAYASDIVITKRGADDEILSCLSHPAVVAMQAAQLDVHPGHRLLEIGAGRGYNAALLAHLVGPRGHVTTIDVDTDIVADARRLLAAAGVGNAEVVLGDGGLGYPAGAPYDRIVATVGAYGIPDSWLSQLAPAGRLVVPLRTRGSVIRSVAFERGDEGGWRSVDHQMCGFVPLRDGMAGDPRQMIALAGDRTVRLQLYHDHPVNAARLAGVLGRPRAEAWTGVTFGPVESVEWMYLWLTCTLVGGLCRMPVEQSAIDSGLVNPMFRWGAMAVAADASLVYLTWRRVRLASDRGQVMETGVVGHGPAGAVLADQVAQEIRAWDERFRHLDVRFEIPVMDTGISDPGSGRFFLDRPHNPLTVTWH
jgi:protein-L-isoaspartate(D-aspartate) O-methyltransferase